MKECIEIENFQNMKIHEKIYFFDIKSPDILINFDGKKVQQFLKNIILDSGENLYIRKKALENFINLVMIKKIKKRSALGILIDEWEFTGDDFLEITRLKKLFLFYEDETEEIEEIYIVLKEHEKNEIKSESLFQLGCIYFLKANAIKDKEAYVKCLKSSLEYFQKSNNCIENRIDAEFFCTVIKLLLDIIQHRESEFQLSFKKMAKLLWQQKLFSFESQVAPLQVGLFRTLNAFRKISMVEPSSWLDYRKEFNQLCYYFYEIKNQEVCMELMESSLLKNMKGNLMRRTIEPLFSLNFKAEICKIEKLLNEADKESEMHKFLSYLKQLISKTEVKENAEKDIIFSKIINAFPNIDNSRIKKEFQKITGDINTHKILNLLELFSEYSYDKLIDVIINACINLQGNQLYRDKTENERNTFLATCLDMAGFYNKDQTLWSKSNEGKTSGEIDIFVKKKNGLPFSIIEALNLDSLKKDYLELHLRKIFGYDTTGLKYNFIIVYSSSKNFSGLWKRYVDHIKKYKYPYAKIDYKEVEEYVYANIKVGKTVHLRNNQEIYLVHIMVDLSLF
ncbi:hypothetical protein [Bacillus sp. FDAARGOS_1420]|uniref:hypothetical protein n=1 Tax=unclassified Bacillus (in: firmicutes) TaxID=185979 RepID=UPI001C5A6C7E|nr:hypothetical protein [Bacillus sp. FDAARGOS_1420]MBW3496194.1 hypothetical protein [Bacillus sp. FDAARGOS_1420]